MDRLLATLVQVRLGVTQDVLAAWFGVHRSTSSRAIGEARPQLDWLDAVHAAGRKHHSSRRIRE